MLFLRDKHTLKQLGNQLVLQIGHILVLVNLLEKVRIKRLIMNQLSSHMYQMDI
jgi:hypothetical protein